MSHCWNQDGSSFSVVCSVVIGLGIFVFITSIFCFVRICTMLKKIRDEKSQNENCELQAEYKIQIEPQHQSSSQLNQQDSIETVETSFVTTTNSNTNAPTL